MRACIARAGSKSFRYYKEIYVMAEALFEELAAQLASDVVSAAQEGAKVRTLEEVVTEIFRQEVKL